MKKTCTFVVDWFGYFYTEAPIKRESGENPEQARCCESLINVLKHLQLPLAVVPGRYQNGSKSGDLPVEVKRCIRRGSCVQTDLLIDEQNKSDDQSSLNEEGKDNVYNKPANESGVVFCA